MKRGVRMRGNHWFLVVAMAVLAAVATPTASSKEKDAARTGTALTGTAVWSSSGFAISGGFDGKIGHGTYTGTLTMGPDRFTTETCGPVCADVTGTIVFAANGGRFTVEVRPGSIVRLEDIASQSLREFTLDLGIVGGTGRYAHAAGVLSLSYSSLWTHTTINGVFVDMIEDTGTLVGKPH
jgi:hypothetical protein